jgi:putative DNA primase/helicase
MIATAAATERPIDRVLRALADFGVHKTGGERWESRCAAHEDHSPSLSVSIGGGGRVLVKCHRGCEFKDIAAALNLTEADFFSDEKPAPAKDLPTDQWPVIATYVYEKRAGVPHFRVQRRQSPVSGRKTFRQHRADGNGGWLSNMSGAELVLYHQPQISQADPKDLVFVVEGEACVESVEKIGLLATTNVGGAGKWRDSYNDALRGRHAVILPDNDEAGRKHAEQVARALTGVAARVCVVELPGLPAKGDVTDWITAGGTADRLRELVERAQRGAVSMVRMSDVAAEDVSWLWPGRIPAGMISILDGPPKVGKSSVVIDLAARITTGRPWPIAVGKNEPRAVILIGHEDSPAHTIRPRLDAAGADPARVHLLTEISGRLPNLPTDIDEIEKAIISAGAALVVFDPISAYLGGADLHRDNEVRAALAPLAAVAERTGAAILFLRHLRKNGGVDAISRGLGSVAIGALARCMMMVLADPDDDAAKLLTWPAINVASQPRSIRWRFDVAPTGKPPRICWDDNSCDVTADQVLDRQDGRQREPSALERATKWLREELQHGRLPSAELQNRATVAGYAERTLKRAREALGVLTARDGHTRTWYSELPKGASPPPTGTGGTLGPLGPLAGEQEGQKYQGGQEPPLRDIGPVGPEDESGDLEVLP